VFIIKFFFVKSSPESVTHPSDVMIN